MRVQLASDLHLELLEREFPRERLIAPATDAEVLVLAGDIHNGTRAIERCSDWPVPVLYLAGNHEFYDRRWEVPRPLRHRGRHGGSIRSPGAVLRQRPRLPVGLL